jgi:TolB-like protein/class 3 adenylate cyclase/Tfp pilus assembly protein PilF
MKQPVERRLAAILAADVAGYSRLMGLDEAGTARALREHRAAADPLIAQHGGRIVKTTGDGILIEFGSVVGAVQCAIGLQKLAAERNTGLPDERRMEWRIGIHLGDVLVEDDDILGDGVNIAARLEGIAEPGGICISDDAFRQVRGKIEAEFADIGEQSLKNIARPLRVYRIGPPPAPDQVTTPSTALPLPDKPSLAVLPFQNMTGDAEQEYFVDGMVEEITTAISRLPWLFVIARNSSFTYKGKAIDVKQVARELGVRYVLEGSVRKAGNRVRITGQLIDAITGNHIWADRFDGALDDIFDLQDRVASSVVGAIEPKLRQSETERASRKPTASLDAYDLYLRALAELHKFAAEGIRQAASWLERALAIDPSYPPAAALICHCRMGQIAFGWGTVSAAERAEATQLAARAIEIGKNDPDALGLAAHALSFFGGALGAAASAVDRAIMLNPNSTYAWTAKGWVSCLRNQPEHAIEAFQRAMRLSPLDPLNFTFAGGIAFAHLFARRFAEAVEWADRSLNQAPQYTPVLRLKLVACVHLGRIQEAHELLQQVLDRQPDLTIDGLRAYPGMTVTPEIFEIWVEGFRKAGLPEE